MKGLASGLLFLSSLIGFTSPWAVRRAKVDVEQPEAIEQSIEIVEEITIGDEPFPTEMVVTQKQELHSLVEAKLPQHILTELDLYIDFQILEQGDRLRFEYEDTVLSRVMVQQNDYERLRVELLPEPTVMLDTFPLDAKSVVMTFDKNDLFAPDADLLDVLDAEPGLIAVIDNQVDIVKELSDQDTIEVLAVGRYRGDDLEYLESVLSLRINHDDTSSLTFKYQTEAGNVWYGEDLKARTYPLLMSPTDYILISSKYGVKRGHKRHKGIDFAADIGTPIYAAASGIVADAGWGTGYGLRTKIDHDHLGDFTTLYAHMSRSYVKTGDVVRQGQLIGLIGTTGRSTGPHLHYELHKGHRQIDPRGRTVRDAFKATDIDSLALESYRDNVDKVFVQATQAVVDVESLLLKQHRTL
jgi:murein DD-endopeptidase MepM/ murein hydrolase activator NlpD